MVVPHVQEGGSGLMRKLPYSAYAEELILDAMACRMSFVAFMRWMESNGYESSPL